jgi:hypothetical protein
MRLPGQTWYIVVRLLKPDQDESNKTANRENVSPDWARDAIECAGQVAPAYEAHLTDSRNVCRKRSFFS